jgi:hypothetical protein
VHLVHVNLIFILLAHSVGHLVSFVSSLHIEKYSIWEYGYPSKYLLGIFTADKPSIKDPKKRLIRLLVRVLILPVYLSDWLFGKHLGLREIYVRPLDDALIRVIRNRLEMIVPEFSRGADNESDFFRFVYHSAVEMSPNHLPKMQSYVALYGFMRALTMVFDILFWISILHMFLADVAWYCDIMGPSLILLLSYITYMGFIKFYRRFSLEVMMAMVVSSSKTQARS